MAKLTTEEKIKEIRNLIPDHAVTLTIFGNEMYHDGMMAGGSAALAGLVTLCLIIHFGEMLSKKI